MDTEGKGYGGTNGESSMETYILPHVNRCMHAKSLQSCLTLCDPMDYSPLGSSVHWILQARILDWIAFPGGSEVKQIANGNLLCDAVSSTQGSVKT